MTDTPQPQSAVSVGLGAQYIKDFSFESPNVPQIFASMQATPEMSIDVNVMSRALGENAYESVLALKLDAKLAGKTAFIAELAYGGIFGLPQMSEEQLRLFLLVEAPRLLFPYARAILSNAIRDGGFPNVAIQPLDFMALYAAQRAKAGNPESGAA